MKRLLRNILISSVVFLFGWSAAHAAGMDGHRQDGEHPRLLPAISMLDGKIHSARSGCGGEALPAVNPDYEQRIIDLVNDARAVAGLPPFKRSAGLDNAARYHATDMGQDLYFDHDTYDRSNTALVYICDTWTRIAHYASGGRGENIASGFLTPESVMNAWMKSPGHRSNILSANWEIGVGYYSPGNFWVQDFGVSSSFPVVINREAAKTDMPVISLYIYGDWQEMRFRNNSGEWSAWQPFQREVNWMLDPVGGEQTVWVELHSATQSALSSDTIILEWPLSNPYRLFQPMIIR